MSGGTRRRADLHPHLDLLSLHCETRGFRHADPSLLVDQLMGERVGPLATAQSLIEDDHVALPPAADAER